MGELRHSIANKDQVKSDSKYLNEDPQIKQNYDDAVQRAEGLINATQNPELLKANIDQATQSVQNAEQALHGAEKLNQDKQTSSTELDGLTDLTDAQREKLREQINSSNSRDDIKQKIEQAKALNDAMKQLKEQVAQKMVFMLTVIIQMKILHKKMRTIMHLNKRKTLLITAQILT